MTRISWWIAISFLFFFSFSIYAQNGEKDWVLDHTTRNYDQQHIRLNLRINFDKEKVFGTAHLRISPLENDFKQLILHSESTEVSAVKINGTSSPFSLEDGLLKIHLNQAYQKGDRFETEIRYTSKPVTGLYFFHPIKDIPEIPYQVWSQGQGEDNHHWFPVYDKPDDKLSSEMIVTVPDTMRAFSNGRLLDVTHHPDKKEKTFHWKTDFEHSSYLISLVVGQYVTFSDTVKGVPLHYNIPADLAQMNPDYPFGRTANMINFYSEYISPYPYSQYSQNPVQDFRYGGMENTTATTLNRRLFHEESAVPNYSGDPLVAHELVHQWFGDLLTCKTWDHIWLNEGITTYFTDLFFEYHYGVDEFRKRRYEQNQDYISTLAKHPIDTLQPSEDGITPIEFSWRKAYTKGSAVMNMLRFELGDELFRKGIRKYVHDYQYQNVVSEDLRKTMEAVSGRDLTQFFKQWVYSAGLPEFKVWWEWNEDAGQMTLYVHQTQDSLPAMDVFKLTVPIEITAGKQLLQERIQLNQREHRFKYALKQKPDMVRFDKGPWILKKLNFEKSFAELKYQLHFDSDVTGRYMAAEQLAYYGDRAIPELKRAIIREPFYWVRKRLVTTLGAIGSSEALDVLKIATEDKDARVREEVMKQLSGFKAEAVQDILYTHLEHDVNDYVRGEAAASLGKVKAENAFDVLKEMLAEDSHRNIIRRGVFRAMKALDDGRALPLAQKYVHYRYSNGGMHLLDMAILDYAESMTYNHQREGLEVIKNALKNPYFRTRKRAAKLLSNYEATETLLLLKNILKSERRNFVRPTLENAIDALSELSSQ